MLCIPNKSNCDISEGDLVAGELEEETTISSPITRFAKERNSSSVKISITFSESTSHMINSSSLNSTSTSQMIVASILDTRP